MLEHSLVLTPAWHKRLWVLIQERGNQQANDFLKPQREQLWWGCITLLSIGYCLYKNKLRSQVWNLRAFEAEAGLQGQNKKADHKHNPTTKDERRLTS